MFFKANIVLTHKIRDGLCSVNRENIIFKLKVHICLRISRNTKFYCRPRTSVAATLILV